MKRSVRQDLNLERENDVGVFMFRKRVAGNVCARRNSETGPLYWPGAEQQTQQRRHHNRQPQERSSNKERENNVTASLLCHLTVTWSNHQICSLLNCASQVHFWISHSDLVSYPERAQRCLTRTLPLVSNTLQGVSDSAKEQLPPKQGCRFDSCDLNNNPFHQRWSLSAVPVSVIGGELSAVKERLILLFHIRSYWLILLPCAFGLAC